VPTEVERGPDGALYVSLLTGFPFTSGVAGVYKIVNGQPQLSQGGFKTITDFTFGPDGSMYVLEHSTASPGFGGTGRLTKVAPNGVRTVITTALNRPTSVLVDDDGAIYVSNNGVSVGTGEVVKIQP
jgi:glucose/arabinose dehydrogenase